MTRSLCTLPRRVNFAVNKTWHQRQDVRLATTLYTGERLAGDFDALPHATFSLCVLATVSTKGRGQAARGGFGRGAAPLTRLLRIYRRSSGRTAASFKKIR
jgi:hypothetical protein